MVVPPQGLSAVSGVCAEARPNTLGQSQSAMNLSRLSPKTEPKKRRAPAPPPSSAPTLTETQMQTQCGPVVEVQVRAHTLLIHSHTHTGNWFLSAYILSSLHPYSLWKEARHPRPFLFI